MPSRLTDLEYAEHQIAAKRRRVQCLELEIDALERLIETLRRTKELQIGAKDERTHQRD